MSKERWADIPWLEGSYQASTFGRIRRATSGPSTKPGRLVKQSKHHSGYMEVSLCVNGIQYKSVRVHKLVLTTFVGAKPQGYQCRHLDGNKQNNHLSNLVWGTPKENARDRHLHRQYNGVRGSQNAKAKLTESQVIEIKKFVGNTGKHKHNKHMTLKQIAQLYCVSVATISAIKNGDTWKHVEVQHV